MTNLTKMVIVSYKNPDFTSETAKYVVRVNPEKYSQNFQIRYDSEGPPGSMNSTLKYERSIPAEMRFELLFDVTGAIMGSATDLAVEIEAFKKVVYDYEGMIHSPQYLRIYWGKMSFGARLSSLSITYTLFRANGEPLRARADAAFTNYECIATIKKTENQRSPDITHSYVVRSGDTLPSLCHRIYGDARFYPDVARENRLTSFRRLVPGRRLSFPPLTK